MELNISEAFHLSVLSDWYRVKIKASSGSSGLHSSSIRRQLLVRGYVR